MTKRNTGDLLNNHYTVAEFGSTDHYLEVIAGNVPGRRIVHRFGRDPNVTVSPKPITFSGFYRTPTVLTELEFLSDSADDSSTGPGGRKIRITGLGANFLEVVQEVTTNGLTPVALPVTLFRLTGWEVIESGTYAAVDQGSHTGLLTLRESGAGEIWSQIDNTIFPRGRAEIGCFSVPAGETAFIISVKTIAESNKPTTVIAFVREGADILTAPFSAKIEQFAFEKFQGETGLSPETPLGPFIGPADIIFDAMVEVTSGTLDLDYELLMIKNPN